MKLSVKLKDDAENGKFSFSFVDGDDKMVVRSQSYKSAKSRDNGVESVKKNSAIDSRYDRQEAKDGRQYFNLKASNGQIVATSKFWATAAERDAAIEGFSKALS